MLVRALLHLNTCPLLSRTGVIMRHLLDRRDQVHQFSKARAAHTTRHRTDSQVRACQADRMDVKAQDRRYRDDKAEEHQVSTLPPILTQACMQQVPLRLELQDTQRTKCTSSTVNNIPKHNMAGHNTRDRLRRMVAALLHTHLARSRACNNNDHFTSTKDPCPN